ncbi:MAG: glycosyltransferase family 39 protein [Thermoflexales bacterium]|nr:glycosyltransferase family 39 protein [Thermoflexales bacterium]
MSSTTSRGLSRVEKAASAGGDGRPGSLAGWRLAPPPRAWAWLLLTLILWAALFLRTHDLPHVPPGPFYDEASAAILAAEVANGASWPIFIRGYTGHEVLYYYVAGLVMRLVDTSYFSLRLASALLGCLTVLTAYLLARELFEDEPLVESHWLGLFAAALMASSFWHVSVSRYGFRAIALPPVQALMFWALWRGLRRADWRWLLAGGGLCGLVAYTYLSSRIVPVGLAVVWGMLLLADLSQWRRWLAQLGLFALPAALVFAPLGLFFLNNPDTFGVRMSQISAFESGDWPAALAQSSLRALELFTLRGDPQLRFNIPDMPMFGGVLAGLFYLGLLVVAVRLVQGGGFRGRVRYGLLVVWPLVMLIPSILAEPYEVPHSLRSMGLMPMIFFVPGLGFLSVLGAVQRFWPPPRKLLVTGLAAGLVALSLGTGLVSTFQNYFFKWALQPRLYYDDHGDIADMARYLDKLPDDGRRLYVGAPDYRSPTVAALAHNYADMKWMTGSLVFVFSPQPALYAWPHACLPDNFWLERFFSPSSRLVQAPGPDEAGAPAYIVHSLDSLPPLSPTHPLQANFANIVQAIGFEVLRERPSGGQTDVLLYWQVLSPPDQSDYNLFARLYDRWGMEWGKDMSFDYPSEQWTPDEVIVQRVRVQTEDGIPPGQYHLEVGWWSASTGQRMPLLDEGGNFAGTALTVGPVPVTRRVRPLDPNTLGMARRLGADLGGLLLLGYSQWPAVAQQGGHVFVSLYWQMPEDAAPGSDHRVRVTLQAAGEGGQAFATSVDGPVHGTYPTSQWEPGEVVADRLALRVPADAPPGAYTVHVQVDELAPQPLGELNVEAVDRLWSQPQVDWPVSATLGSQIKLVGYRLDSSRLSPGQSIQLELVWQSLVPADEGYTVFVHLLDASGALRGQKDNPPVNGTYPTTLWQPGEFVLDRYEIALPPDLPPGEYTLQTGMYLPGSGQRLAVSGGSDGVTSDGVVLGKLSLGP